MERTIQRTDELPQLAADLLEFAGDRKIFLFYGDIGAGKTTFIQAICAHLGIQEPVTSPTFSLINEYNYAAEGGEEAVLYHMDLYRLEDLEEALGIGVEDYLEGDAYCFVEWPELIEPLLPEEVVRIKMEQDGDSSRKILFLLG